MNNDFKLFYIYVTSKYVYIFLKKEQPKKHLQMKYNVSKFI
jgi:hypothetical protein